MVLNIRIFNEEIQHGEVFKVVVTKIHSVHEPFKAELKFVCKKGGGNDWAIYAGKSDQSVEWIKAHGQKVTSERNIQGICPCTPDVLELYRY